MNKNKKQIRSPVVVILGHVDHGKSSLLQAIKDFKITQKESGGITQHIGAYVVSHQGKGITFIDTPGHEAFSAIRERSAKVADVGVLVVAVDESVKEQTKEAISYLQQSEMPFLVVMNKMDKENADPERVKQDLSREGVFLESYGGKIPSVSVSATKKEGLDEFLEIILLLAEMEELQADYDSLAEGVVIETHLDQKRGISATLLVKNGILKKGDIVATQSSFGKIRIMEDFLGKETKEAGPSMPAKAIGFKKAPSVGEVFFAYSDAGEAKKIASEGQKIIERCFTENEKESLNVIIKADAIGSLEAIESSFKKIPQEEIGIKLVKEGIGNISELDIKLAKITGSKVFSFRVEKDKAAESIAIRENIEVKRFDVIYELVEEIKKEAELLLSSEIVRSEKAKIKILAVFRTLKNRQILGGKVEEGEARKGLLAEVWREGEKVAEGKLINLKKEEKDMEKVSEREELGMLFEGNGKAQEGDIIVLYEEEKIKKTL